MAEDLLQDVSLSLTSAEVAKKMAMALVQINPDQARELLIELGNTEIEADAKMIEYLDAIKASETKAAMKGTADAIVTSLQEAVAAIDLPDNVAKLTVSVKYDGSDHPDTGQSIGWIVTNPAITPEGSDKAINFGSKATGPRKTGGGKAKVKITDEQKAQGYNSWSAYAKATYPDEVDSMKGQSVPRWLARKKDPVFMAAATDQGISYEDDAQGLAV